MIKTMELFAILITFFQTQNITFFILVWQVKLSTLEKTELKEMVALNLLKTYLYDMVQKLVIEKTHILVK